ncbi:hypothetical protein AOLI_G00104190 [Acnodon oligacanthus]
MLFQFLCQTNSFSSHYGVRSNKSRLYRSWSDFYHQQWPSCVCGPRLEVGEASHGQNRSTNCGRFKPNSAEWLNLPSINGKLTPFNIPALYYYSSALVSDWVIFTKLPLNIKSRLEESGEYQNIIHESNVFSVSHQPDFLSHF